MKSKTRLPAFGLFLFLIPGVCFGGAIREELTLEIDRLAKYLQKAQAVEGPTCVPDALATAQVYLTRAKEELEEKDYWRAEDFVHLCQKEANGLWEHILACRKDLDRDGIADPNDDCIEDPETYNGYVDDDGCPDRPPRRAILTTYKIEILEPIAFDQTTQEPLPESEPVLAELATVMRDNPDLRFLIEGHCSEGLPTSEALDMTLARASNLRDMLVQRGISGDRLEVVGRGAKDPIASNESEWGRRLNRRIEILRLQ